MFFNHEESAITEEKSSFMRKPQNSNIIMCRSVIISLLILAASFSGAAQNIYELTEPSVEKTIRKGHLALGGKSPDGGSIDVNSYYLSIDGKPTIPVLGEFHYSRYPADQWEEEILKIKAGGVTVIPTYIFWNLHEEVEGVFNWEGDRDIRRFINICKKHDMPVIVRIGPFCHGEIRNGGFPDWLFAKPLEIRSNDPNYLYYVDKFYGEIAKQLDGLYYKDGGPIIGCQIENEHQHSAAPWALNYPGAPNDYTSATYDASITMIGVSAQDKEITTADLGDIHMKTLKDIAVSKGIDTPLYTATGWGNAAVIGNEAIPVTAAYTYPFWTEPEMSRFCLFKDIHACPDYDPVRYEPLDFPSFCVEMGVGIQMMWHRRPIVPGKAAEALMVRTLGSGSNGIGYYMYHGGSTPKQIGGVGSFNDEPMGTPKISYDFQGPLGEFGLEGASYRNLRLLHTFLADFGDILAPMETVLPEGWEKMTPDNRDDLRYAARMKDGSGFVFMVNFQDHDLDRHDQSGLRLSLNLNDETLKIPGEGTFTLPKDQSMIIPFNLMMNGALLKYATAQLLMKINDEGYDHYFFFAPEGLDPEFVFDGNTVSGKKIFRPKPGLGSTFNVNAKNGKKIKVTVLTREQALNSSKVDGKLLITEATVVPENGHTRLLSLGKRKFDYVLYPSAAGFNTCSVEVEEVKPEFEWKKVGARRMTVSFDTPATGHVHEYFLNIDYTGDVAMAFIGGTMILDHFWYGQPWKIGLKRLTEKISKEDLVFYFRPIERSFSYLIDIPEDDMPDFSDGSVCAINNVEIIPQYVITLEL